MIAVHLGAFGGRFCASVGNPPQVESILAKPNYRHQKKQKEEARKLRQAEKHNRRLAARQEAAGSAAASPTDETASPAPSADATQATP